MRRTCSLAIAALAACGDPPSITQPRASVASARGEQDAGVAHYEIVKLPLAGRSPNRGSGIDNRGWVAGFSTTANGERHATLWRAGEIVDLGTLGGPHSTVQWPGINDNGMVVGISQTAEPDPLGEEWSCSAFLPSSGNVCLGFVWDGGAMRALPTLGGTNGFATGVNDRGQVVGWAETPVRDPTCDAPQVLQFRAVLWEPRRGSTRELRPLAGDSTSAATAINERGDVVGISGDCNVAVGNRSARRAVIWRHGEPSEIPNLGGEFWHTPMAINERGHVVGFSNPPGVTGGALIPHAFLWTGGDESTDLGMLPADDNSQALGINARGQVVGVSCKGNACRAFVWQRGVMRSLQSLAVNASGDSLIAARSIDDAGRITGNLLERSTGRVLAYVATPRPRD